MSRPQPADDTLSMIPMMNLVTILIPFVLMGASFAPLAVVEVSVPGAGPASTGEAANVARLLVTPQQIAVEWRGEVVDTMPCNGGCRTYDAVPADALAEVLDRLDVPQGTSLVVAVQSDVPYDVVIASMDASGGNDSESRFSGVSLGSL